MPGKSISELNAYIGACLRVRHLMLGMSQKALGKKLSLTFQQIQKYEKGTSRVSASRLYELAQALDVPVQYFSMGLKVLFLQIGERKTRCDVLATIEGIAGVSAY